MGYGEVMGGLNYNEHSDVAKGALDRLLQFDVWIASKTNRGAERIPIAKVRGSFVGVDSKKIFAGYEVELIDGQVVSLYSDNKVEDEGGNFIGTWSKGDPA